MTSLSCPKLTRRIRETQFSPSIIVTAVLARTALVSFISCEMSVLISWLSSLPYNCCKAFLWSDVIVAAHSWAQKITINYTSAS